MPLPIPLIMAGIAAFMLFGGDDKKTDEKATTPGGAPPPPPGPGPGGTVGPGPGGLGTIPITPKKPPTDFGEIVPEILPFGNCLDQGIPKELEDMVLNALKNVADPNVLDALAATAAQAGFPKVAACLQAQANKLRGTGGGTGTGLPQSGDMPYTLGFGDYPYGLATYYTGAGGRYKELEPLNPQIGPMVANGAGPGVAGYKNWNALAASHGKILLPASWSPWQKPVPIKPTGGSGYKASGALPGPGGA